MGLGAWRRAGSTGRNDEHIARGGEGLGRAIQGITKPVQGTRSHVICNEAKVCARSTQYMMHTRGTKPRRLAHVYGRGESCWRRERGRTGQRATGWAVRVTEGEREIYSKLEAERAANSGPGVQEGIRMRGSDQPNSTSEKEARVWLHDHRSR